jgi:hypothetical protein
MKLKHIAAAMALIATGAANAAIATGGNGSLVLIAYDKTASGSFATTAGVFDLGLSVDDLIGSTGNGSGAAATSLAGLGKNVVWDFVGNTIKVDGVTTAFGGTNSWNAAFSTLLANTDADQLKFVVTGFDTTGSGPNVRSIVTGTAGNTTTFTTSQAAGLNLIGGTKANDIFTPIVNKGTIASAANGAYTYTTADGAATRINGYAMAGDAFGNNWRNNNVLNGETLASNSASLYVVDGTAAYKEFATVAFSAANGTLTLTTAAVPEPTTYALVIAGLAVLGAAARRRAA